MVSSAEHHKLDRREINAVKGSENIVNSTGGREVRWKVRRTLKSIWCALRRRMRAREMEKTGAVKSYLNGLWISHLSGDAKCNVASAPNITLELTIILISPNGSNDLPHFAICSFVCTTPYWQEFLSYFVRTISHRLYVLKIPPCYF